MASVSHRDGDTPDTYGVTLISGSGSPEGAVAAAVGCLYQRTDGSTGTTFYVKETGGSTSTGWRAVVDSVADVATLTAAQAVLEDDLTTLAARVSDAETDILALEGDVQLLDGRLDTAETDIDALDTTLGGRLDLIEADNWVTTARVTDGDVTNAKLADMAASTLKGSIAGGAPADLSATQATALLDAVSTSAKGLVPTAPNNAAQFLNGTGAWSAPKQRMFLTYAVDVVTAGSTARFLNTIGFTTTPAGTTAYAYPISVAGYLISTRYVVAAVHTTNTVVVTPRLSGVDQPTQALTVAAGVQASYVVHATPLAVTPGTGTSLGDYLACKIDHNGATNLTRCFVIFEIEY